MEEVAVDMEEAGTEDTVVTVHGVVDTGTNSITASMIS
jgi:hypothetical protein